MSGYRLCRVEPAEKPFYIETIGVNIFTLEELCYYIVNDMALLDETLMNKTLTAWIGTELKLPELAETLNYLLADGADADEFVIPILKEDGYLSYNEFQNFRMLLTKQGKEPRRLRLKKKADALVGSDKLVGAIAVYRKVLELDLSDAKDSFVAAVHHNMGVAFVRLFRYREALECFEKALKVTYTREYLKTYLFAYALSKPRDKYEEKCAELGVDDRTRAEVEEELRAMPPEVPVAEGEIDRYLSGLTRAYHRAADA
ncbi:MAG: tetratricopeptide repeat protein [Lachnospiraceae bacterium]|nr:tetratricopeptide repeat protein [Lachnospiraceae bacterium]